MTRAALKRHLGVSYPPAWALHHKINRAMAAREATHTLAGEVQIDDAYLGGEYPGGKPGRGSENKVAFVAAVSLDDKGNPRYIKLQRAKGFTCASIQAWAQAALRPGCQVASDGLACFAAVTQAGCIHNPVVVPGRLPCDLPQFKWVNTVLGNLETSLHGTYHLLGWDKHADSCIAAFAYRFNRRFDLRGLLARPPSSRCGTLPTSQNSVDSGWG